ncbi:MAG: hypothetical protein ACLP41_02475 [Acidimicrobiales bacterium]
MNIDQLFGENFETEHLAQHRDESKTRIGDGVVVIEHHRQARRAVRKWHRKGAFLIWRIGSLASPILPDHGTFFADGQAIKGLSAWWFQAKARGRLFSEGQLSYRLDAEADAHRVSGPAFHVGAQATSPTGQHRVAGDVKVKNAEGLKPDTERHT